MSYNKQTTVRCDFCVNWEMYTGTLAYVRKILKNKGWCFLKGKDICPNCVKEHRA